MSEQTEPRCANCGYEDELSQNQMCYNCWNAYEMGRESITESLVILLRMVKAKEKEAYLRLASASGNDYDYNEGLSEAYGIMTFAIADILGVEPSTTP